MKSTTKAWLGLGSVSVVMALILFGCAGTVHYWQAWVFLAVTVSASVLQTTYLVRKDPALLERRLRGGPSAEKEKAQKVIMTLTSLGYVALLAVPALDRRFGWSDVPTLLSVLADLFVAIGYGLIFFVFKENSFAAATVQVAPDQRVISSGPYAIVRHPMYVGALTYFYATPLALGSYWGLIVCVIVTPVLIWRIFDEERVLTRNLPGYPEYRAKVRWRLIPGIF